MDPAFSPPQLPDYEAERSGTAAHDPKASSLIDPAELIAIPTTLTTEPPPPSALATPVPPPLPVPAPPSAQELLHAHVVDAVADTLHKIDIRGHLEMLARTEPKTFRQWVEMCLPKAPGNKGNQQANIINVHSALPKSDLDKLPPGFDIHV